MNFNQEVNTETGEYKTDAPWGKLKGNIGSKSTIKDGLVQLVYYKNDGRVPSQYLLDDINGYEQILNSSSLEENAELFLKTKQSKYEGGKVFANNLKVVEFLKENDKWIN